jgi:glycyl-tRNA synthetase
LNSAKIVVKLFEFLIDHHTLTIMTTETSSSFKLDMDTLISLCKRRSFIFQSSEIYGGLNGFFDYGPMGAELRKNIKEAWWQDMVHRRDDMVGLDSTIIMHPQIWKSSGHVDGFVDPMVDCKESKMRYRADHLHYSAVKVNGEIIGYVSLLETAQTEEDALKMANELKRKLAKQGTLDPLNLKQYIESTPEEQPHIPSPATGKPGSLTPARQFNLMFKTSVGALEDASAVAYLRPETAQGIFVNFKNIIDTSRVKLPFGIAQVGKAFRNEITPRNFIFRSREFEQMEIEYFISGDENAWQAYHQEWIQTRLNWFHSIGIPKEFLSLEVHPKDKLAHYAKACTDIIFNYPFGKQELEGIAARGNFDLTQHQTGSGKSLEYFDDQTKQKFLPHVIEPSVGVDRTLLAVLCSAYYEDEVEGEKRIALRLHPRIAPIKAGVFPLLKNKPELVEKAKAIYKSLQRRWNVFYDETGAIGRRYRRMDEVGTPFGITVDFDTLEKGTVTLRDRDTTQQIRIAVEEIIPYLEARINP